MVAKKKQPCIVTLDVNEAPAVLRESFRAVLGAHGYVIAKPITELANALADVGRVAYPLVELDSDVFERVLRELGNNAAQALFVITEPERD